MTTLHCGPELPVFWGILAVTNTIIWYLSHLDIPKEQRNPLQFDDVGTIIFFNIIAAPLMWLALFAASISIWRNPEEYL